MASVIRVPKEITPNDFIPTYTYFLQDLEVNEEEAFKVKEYFRMFLEENFELLKEKTKEKSLEALDSYLEGARDAIALFNLFIDSVNTKEESV